MGNYRDEIERFIYEICYQPIWASVSDYVSQHLSLLDLTYSRVKYPDSAYVEDMLLEFTKNIRIDEDMLSFDAVVSCTMNLTEDNYRGTVSCDLSQWFFVSCEAVIEDKLRSLTITSVQQYTPGLRTQRDGQPVSKNIVPILYKKDLEAEASAFLEKYCPEALGTPMPVPIAEIAETMGLDVVEGHRITDDFSIFGEIYFSPGRAEVYDLFQCASQEIEVRRGTILIDANTYWERNLGCVKNTIAHEVYHWYKLDHYNIEIDGREVKFKASAAIPRIYRIRFHRDIYKDLSALEKAVGSGNEEDSNLDLFSLEMFENIVYVMAKHADPSIPDTPEEWLDEFNTFSIYQVLPQIIELWGLNVQTDVQSKKNAARLTGK